MVANVQGDVGQQAAEPQVAELKAARAEVVDDRQPTEDQVAAAAAATDAEHAAAVEVAADAGILPTDAPIQSIGEYAQAPAPATTTTPTPAPAAEEAAPQYNPWVVGGAALLGIGAIAAAASSGDDDNPTPAPAPGPEPGPGPAPAPGPGPGPAPAPVNTPPTSADGQVNLDPSGTTIIPATAFPFTDADAGDALSKVKIGTITMVDAASATMFFDPTTGHGYELVSGAIGWEAARDAAVAKGGYLAVLDTVAEMQMINDKFVLGSGTGTDGTWVGAQQAADQATPGTGWTWVNGTPLDASATSPLWNNQGGAAEPNDADGTENNAENFGALFDGAGGTNLIYDAGPDGGTGTQAAYLIEYDGALRTSTGTVVTAGQEIAAADLAGGLTWNSLFNAGGTVTFSVADSQGAFSTPENTLTISAPPVATSLSSLVDDQHLTSLA